MKYGAMVQGLVLVSLLISATFKERKRRNGPKRLSGGSAFRGSSGHFLTPRKARSLIAPDVQCPDWSQSLRLLVGRHRLAFFILERCRAFAAGVGPAHRQGAVLEFVDAGHAIALVEGRVKLLRILGGVELDRPLIGTLAPLQDPFVVLDRELDFLGILLGHFLAVGPEGQRRPGALQVLQFLRAGILLSLVGSQQQSHCHEQKRVLKHDQPPKKERNLRESELPYFLLVNRL